MERKIKSRALWQRVMTVTSRRPGTHGEGSAGAEGSGANCIGENGSGSSSGAAGAPKNKTSLHSLATSLLDQRYREKDLKAKADELDDVRGQLELELDNQQQLKKEVAQLQSSLTDATQKLQRAAEVADRIRAENKRKSEQVEKLERVVSHQEDRIRNLEIRASEVEKAELTLELTRRNLESSQQECRAKEGEIRRLTDKYDKICLDLETANKKISELEKKIEDLKIQVRHELMKNENIEQGLETIPHLKDDIQERDKKILELQKEMDQKTALLIASRKAVRDYKDKIRDLEYGEAMRENLQEELELTRCEVTTLKHLMSGKDSLLLSKCQALDQAREIIDTLPKTQDENEKLRQIQQILTRLSSIPSDGQLHKNEAIGNDTNRNVGSSQHRSVPGTQSNHKLQETEYEISVDTVPFNRPNGDTQAYQQYLQNSNQARTSTPTQMAVVRPVCRSASLNHAQPQGSCQNLQISGHSKHKQTVNRPNTANVYKSKTYAGTRFTPSLDYPFGSRGWVQPNHNYFHSPAKLKPRPYSALVSSQHVVDLNSNEDSQHTDSEVSSKDEHLLEKAQLSAQQKDEILSSAINIGDRVTFSIPQKPPRYGKKKKKPVLYTGIVKYIGQLDSEHCDARTYVGLRLDEPIGEHDGICKGKRYMFTPHNHAKFFKIQDVSTVLNVKSGQYVPASHLLLKHIKKTKIWDECNEIL